MISEIEYGKHHGFLHSEQLAYFMSNLMNCYNMVLKKKNKVMCQPDISNLWKQCKMLLSIFFSKIKEVYYHCGGQNVCECKNVHYLHSNLNACGNLLYIAPSEQTTPTHKELS